MAGLCREAVDRALADAGLTFADIDAVVVGKAPDLFEGVMMPELYLADALGAVGKPLLRVHTAGLGRRRHRHRRRQPGPGRACTGGCSRSRSRSSRSPTRCGRCRSRRRSACRWWPGPAGTSRRTSAPTSAAAARPSHIGAMVAVKDRRNGALQSVRAPAAAGHHAGVGAGLPDAVGSGPLRRDLPVVGRRLRGDHRRRGGGAGFGGWRPAGGVDPGDRDADRADHVLRQGPGEPGGRGRGGGRAVVEGRASPRRSTRSTWPRSTCRSPGTSRCGWRTSGSPRPARGGG